MTTFSGAPCTWGSLLRTIDVRPRELTCIATSGQSIIAGCEQIVEIYDAITGVLQQSLSASETVTKIQASPDRSTLFFAHELSVTMWDVQTGGLIHTFTTESQINDIAVSMVGDYVACGSDDGTVKFWNIRTKEEGKCHWISQPVIAICWFSSQRLAVATQDTFYICGVPTGKTLDHLSMPNFVWGMIYFGDKDEFLVGTSDYIQGEKWTSFETISLRCPKPLGGRQATVELKRVHRGKRSLLHFEMLRRPTLVDKEVACVTSPSGIQLFNIESHKWTSKPPLLNMVTSVAVSLNRNLVAQTKDSIQVLESLDVLKSGETHNNTHPPRIYPLGDNHICVLQPTTGRLTLLELETMQELHPGDNASSFGSLLADQSLSASLSFVPEVAAEHRISAVIEAWKSGTPLLGRTEFGYGVHLLRRLSPERTRIVTVYRSHPGKISVEEASYLNTLRELPLVDELEKGELYDLTFDSEERLNLKFKGPGWHVQIPYDITPFREITKGEPVPFPQETPYTLDANLEWVLDVESRKICWIPPGNIRKGMGGYFWAGPSLVMVGDDGVVRKLTFKEPDC